MNLDKEFNEIVTCIKKLLGDDLDLIVLFGSQSTGDTHPQSDIDIGVQVSNHKKELQETFGDLLSLFDYVDKEKAKVDVTLLNLADFTLLYRVVRDGKLLYSKNDDVWPCFVEYVLGRYPDWEYFIETYLKQSLGA